MRLILFTLVLFVAAGLSRTFGVFDIFLFALAMFGAGGLALVLWAPSEPEPEDDATQDDGKDPERWDGLA